MRTLKKKKVMLRKFENAKSKKKKKKNLHITTKPAKKLRRKRKLQNIRAAQVEAKENQRSVVKKNATA